GNDTSAAQLVHSLCHVRKAVALLPGGGRIEAFPIVLNPDYQAPSTASDLQQHLGSFGILNRIVECFLDDHEQSAADGQVEDDFGHLRFGVKDALDRGGFQELLRITADVSRKIAQSVTARVYSPEDFVQSREYVTSVLADAAQLAAHAGFRGQIALRHFSMQDQLGHSRTQLVVNVHGDA